MGLQTRHAGVSGKTRATPDTDKAPARDPPVTPAFPPLAFPPQHFLLYIKETHWRQGSGCAFSGGSCPHAHCVLYGHSEPLLALQDRHRLKLMVKGS